MSKHTEKWITATQIWFILQRDLDIEQTYREMDYSNSDMVYTAERLGHSANIERNGSQQLRYGLYGRETWTLSKHLEKRITATQMWFIR